MTTRAESIGLGAHAELRAWYLDHLRPRLVEAVAARVVRPGAVDELDLQVAALLELPGGVSLRRGRTRAGSVATTSSLGGQE